MSGGSRSRRLVARAAVAVGVMAVAIPGVTVLPGAAAVSGGAIAAAPGTGVALGTGVAPGTVSAPEAAAPLGATSTPVTRPPRDSGKGPRIVYSRPRQHVWIIGSKGNVQRDFPVTGRADWPRAGKYRVFSKSPSSYSPTYGVAFNYMVRFAHGNSADIGFHTIPTSGGRPIQPVSTLGQPLGLGGCVRSATPNARFIYRWADIGTRVVVL